MSGHRVNGFEAIDPADKMILGQIALINRVQLAQKTLDVVTVGETARILAIVGEDIVDACRLKTLVIQQRHFDAFGQLLVEQVDGKSTGNN